MEYCTQSGVKSHWLCSPKNFQYSQNSGKGLSVLKSSWIIKTCSKLVFYFEFIKGLI